MPEVNSPYQFSLLVSCIFFLFSYYLEWTIPPEPHTPAVSLEMVFTAVRLPRGLTCFSSPDSVRLQTDGVMHPDFSFLVNIVHDGGRFHTIVFLGHLSRKMCQISFSQLPRSPISIWRSRLLFNFMLRRERSAVTQHYCDMMSYLLSVFM